MTLADPQRSSRTVARGTSAIAVSLALLSSCGHDSPKMTAPSSPVGVESGVMSAPVDVLQFSSFVTEVMASDWSRDGRLTPPWSYDAASGAWRFVTDSYHSVFVGNGEASTEIRDQITVTIVTVLLRTGVVQQELMSADQARMDMTIRRHRYAVDPSYALADGYDVQVTQHMEFALSAGNADTLRTAGVLTGWADRTSNGRSWRASYDGSMTLRFDYPDHYVSCPGQELAADVRILDGGAEVDRYRGAFVAARDDSHYAGALVSEHGAGRVEIDSDRGCPPPAVTLQTLLAR